MNHKVLSIILSLSMVGCSSTAQVTEATTLPEPLYTTELPAAPPEVPRGARVVVPVESCQVEGEDAQIQGPGFFFSPEMTERAARLGVSYDEMRALYEIDIRTRARERVITERLLADADAENQRLAESAKRTWWENHGDVVSITVGLVLGVTAGVGAHRAATR